MKKDYQLILFDLDGTLTDPKIGITKSVQYALAKYHIPVSNINSLEKFIGPPLFDSFQKYYHFNDQDAKQAIAYYREYFAHTGIYENQVYPDMVKLLRDLHAHGKTLVVATSKPTVYAKRIIEHFQLDAYFNLIVGSHLDGTRVKKQEIISAVLEQYAHIPKHAIVMIGDRHYDINGAKAHHIDSIAVAYGYAQPGELAKAQPTYVVTEVHELAELLTNSNKRI